MPIQTENLVLVGLGLSGDTPPDALQPSLKDGVHLRWAGLRERGFPWHGFFLFRRNHGRGEMRCVGGSWGSNPGDLPSTYPLPFGIVSSDRPLRLTDDFPPASRTEFDLQDRDVLRFDFLPNLVSSAVNVQIGFRQRRRTEPQCLDLRELRAEEAPNPLIEGGFRVMAGGRRGQTWIAVRRREAAPRLTGLSCDPFLTIALPIRGTAVTLEVSAPSREALRIEAVEADGRLLPGTLEPANEGRHLFTARVEGERIASVRVSGRTGALLHHICVHVGRDDIRVRALMGGVSMAEQIAQAPAGKIVTVVLAADAIDAVEVSGGAAALVDLCFAPVASDAARGWRPVEQFSYPMALPVRHPDYPASQGAPDPAASRTLALGRVAYGSPASWAAAFPDLHDALTKLVAGGPGGPAMADKVTPSVQGVPPNLNGVAPHLGDTRTLDLVLLGTLNRAMADMIGLSFLDESAVPGDRYDYLIVASHDGAGAKGADDMLAEIAAHGFTNVDGFIAYDLAVEPKPPLASPTGLRSYALPGATLAGDVNGSNNAGLRWTPPPGGLLSVSKPVLHLVWRSDCGNGTAPVAAPFRLITKAPVLVADPILSTGSTPQRASDWPPFLLHYLDARLAEGWYAYKVTGIDIFGRHSPPSASAAWFQWAPAPDPVPWYYLDPPAERVVNADAVRLLDKLPPPPPTAIEAYALDPADPTVLRDAAYTDWLASLTLDERPSLVGLRVRWQWTFRHMQQAPDATEFRIYYKAGQPNVLLGTITATAPVDPTQSTVTTDIPSAAPDGALIGGWMRVGTSAFPILASSGNPLTLRVGHLGLTATAGTVSVSAGAAEVNGVGTAWHAGMTGLHFRVDGQPAAGIVMSVDGPTALRLSAPYAGPTADGQAYVIYDRRPPASGATSLPIPESYAAGSVALTNGSMAITGTGTHWSAALVGMPFKVAGDAGRYRVDSVAGETSLTLDRAYDGPTRTGVTYAIASPLFVDYRQVTNWDQRQYVVPYDQHVTITVDAAGRPLRRYEVIIPVGSDALRAGLPLATTLAAPIAYAQVSVSTADGRPHSPDAPKWDGTPFGSRPGNEGVAGAMATVFRVRREPPPPPVPPPDAERVYATPADYHSRSFYTYRWVSILGLTTHLFRGLDDAVFQQDWRQRPRPPLDPTQLALFPGEPRWDLAKRQQVAAELDHLNDPPHTDAGNAQAQAIYRALSSDGLRVLAGLPGNDLAFTQITTVALDPSDAANADRRGPDSPAGYVPDPALRAYVDTLDGRSTNRYFYRAAYVDGANNIGPLSISSPPVWLPNVVPPAAPVLTRMLGGDRAVTVTWASSREADLAAYRLYRAPAGGAARDIRLMTLVHEEPVPAGDPQARPAELSFVDAPLPGLVTVEYRLVAIDTAGNASVPSPAVAGRAYDESLPVAPVPTVAWVTAGGTTRAEISWTSLDETMLQRRDPGRTWVEVAAWRAPGIITLRDPFSDPLQSYEYRVWARRSTGAVARGVAITLPPA